MGVKAQNPRGHWGDRGNRAAAAAQCSSRSEFKQKYSRAYALSSAEDMQEWFGDPQPVDAEAKSAKLKEAWKDRDRMLGKRRGEDYLRRRSEITAAQQRKKAEAEGRVIEWEHPEHGVRLAWYKDLCDEFGGSMQQWGAVFRGKEKRVLGWSVKGRDVGPKYASGDDNPSADRTVYTFENVETGDLFHGTRLALCATHGVSRAGLRTMLSAGSKNKSAGGWKLAGSDSAAPKRKSDDQHWTEAMQNHAGSGYEFDRIERTGPNRPVYVHFRCPAHGAVRMLLPELKRGHGCRECGRLKAASTNAGAVRVSDSEYMAKITAVHGDTYTYNSGCIDRTDVSAPYITYTCEAHGECRQLLHSHISGHGCLKCSYAISKPRTHSDEVIDGCCAPLPACAGLQGRRP